MNKELNLRRKGRYEFCTKHVDKTVDSIKDTSKSTKKLQKWQEELTPARLFRGWWEELKKAYLRFCLQDMSDCARRCNVVNGMCRLVEDRQQEDDNKRWQYKCTCEPGYGPWQSANTADQHLCSIEVKNLDTSGCGPLNTIDESMTDRMKRDDSSQSLNRPIDHKYLCNTLKEGKVVYKLQFEELNIFRFRMGLHPGRQPTEKTRHRWGRWL